MSTENRVLPHPLLTHDRLAQFFWIVMDVLSRQNALPLEMSKVRDLPDIEQVLRDYFAQDPDDFERGRARLIDSAIFHWQMMRLVMPADDAQYTLTADGIEWLETYKQDSSRALDLFRERMSQTLWFAQTGLSGAELETYLRTHATPIRKINLDDQIRTAFTILTYFGLTGDETKPSAPESATSPFSLTQTDENPTIDTAPIDDVSYPTETDENPTIADKPMTEENSQPSWLDEDKRITVSRGNMHQRGGAGDTSTNPSRSSLVNRIKSITDSTETHKPSTQPRRYGGSNEDTLGPRARGNRQPQTNPTNEGQPPTTRKPPTSPTPPTSDKPKPTSDKALGFLQGDNPRDRLSRVPKGDSSSEGTSNNRRERADYHPKGPRAKPRTSQPSSVSEPILHEGEYYYEEQLPNGRVIRLSKKVVDDLMTEHGITREEAIRILRNLQG